MILLKTKSPDERVMMTLQMYDKDGNGKLSWDELFEMVKLTLECKGDQVLEEAAAFEVEQIFKIC